MALADMKSTLVSGRIDSTRFASSRPLIPGMTMSVTRSRIG